MASFWECSKCDFVNRTTDASCKACGGPPPPSHCQGGEGGVNNSAPAAAAAAAAAAAPYSQTPAASAPQYAPQSYSTGPRFTPQEHTPTVQGSYVSGTGGRAAQHSNTAMPASTSVFGNANAPQPGNTVYGGAGGAYHSAPPAAYNNYGGGGHSAYHGKDAKYKHDFDRIDKDHSGYIDRHDIKKMLKGTISDSKIEKVLKIADKDKDGRVSFDEYKKIMKKVEMAQKLVGKKFLK